MATAGNVLPFRNKETNTGEALIPVEHLKPRTRIITDDEVKRENVGKVSIEDLYPVSEATAPELDTAIKLLSKGLEYVNDAFNASVAEDLIASDDALQRLQALMPELFNCRAIGDGYGAIINALLSTLENRQGEILTQPQIVTLRQVLYRVRQEPFVSFNAAVDEIEKLEDAGFSVEPQGFDALADWLDG